MKKRKITMLQEAKYFGIKDRVANLTPEELKEIKDRPTSNIFGIKFD